MLIVKGPLIIKESTVAGLVDRAKAQANADIRTCYVYLIDESRSWWTVDLSVVPEDALIIIEVSPLTTVFKKEDPDAGGGHT